MLSGSPSRKQTLAPSGTSAAPPRRHRRLAEAPFVARGPADDLLGESGRFAEERQRGLGGPGQAVGQEDGRGREEPAAHRVLLRRRKVTAEGGGGRRVIL